MTPAKEATPTGTPKVSEKPPTVEEYLEEIVYRLERLDKRDKMRTYGSVFKSAIMVIPTVVLLLSLWYVYERGDDLLQQIIDRTMSAAASQTQSQSQDFIRQLQQYMK